MTSRRQFLSGSASFGAAGLGLAALGTAGVGARALWYEPGAVVLRPLELVVPGLAPGLDGLTLAQLTDVHLTSVHRAAQRCGELLAEVLPDVVVLTGDIVEDPADLPELEAWLPQVRGRLATFATMGNWEHWGGLSRALLEGVYHRAGVQLLHNGLGRVERQGAALEVVGLDDGYVGQPAPEAVLGALGPDPALWLTHAPAYVDALGALPAVLEAPRPALVLSGHTHGGQVRHPFGPITTPPGSGRFVRGWYRDTWAPLYVSQGVGTSLVPVRLLCRPELPVFTLRSALA